MTLKQNGKNVIVIGAIISGVLAILYCGIAIGTVKGEVNKSLATQKETLVTMQERQNTQTEKIATLDREFQFIKGQLLEKVKNNNDDIREVKVVVIDIQQRLNNWKVAE